MRLLVDTNIWIDHFQKKSDALTRHLQEGEVLLHPLIVGELALGQFKNRALVMGFLHEMPVADELTHEECLSLIETRSLFGRGIGLVDTLLLGAAMITRDCRLWTGDQRLAAIAEECGVGY